MTKEPIEYAEFIRTGVYGQLLIESGSHARGRTLNVWVIECGYQRRKVKVYGVIGGHPGWSEVCGWIHYGPWIEDFMVIAKRFEQEAIERKARVAEEFRLREDEKVETDVKILMNYRSPGGEP